MPSVFDGVFIVGAGQTKYAKRATTSVPARWPDPCKSRIASAGNVFETASSRTEPRMRWALFSAASMRWRATCHAFSYRPIIDSD